MNEQSSYSGATPLGISQDARPECDLVMKGGITSGVIYPRLVSELSKIYTFRSIGGTSAGAIAAAAAAAAQLGVLAGTNREAFAKLDGLPTMLGGKAVNAQGSMLLNLFQPQKPFRRHFALLKAALNAPSKVRLMLRVALGAIRQFPVGALIGTAIGVVIILTSHGVGRWLGGFLAVIGLVLGALIACALSLVRDLPGNVFGLCSGMPGNAKGPPALTTWLHDYLNGLAGKTSDDPLTFGELWAGRLRGAGQPSPHHGEGRKEVELAMMTTSLNIGRPFRLPFEANIFYFLEDELKLLFPEKVVAWLVEHARPSATANALSVGDRKFYALPVAQDLPVLVAVRMSLSFPVLLSAIPLYTVDWTLGINAKGATVPTKVLFSDGGICSNFPIQFFDGPLPSRPTFGVDLGDFQEDHKNQRVWLPPPLENKQGIKTFIPPISDGAGLASIAAFIGAIVNTMQNWNDQMQIVMPGFRDRIIHISHTGQEGGLNLDMASATIQILADSGREAGDVLMKAFAERAEPGKFNAWDNHRRIRVRSLLSGIDQQARRLHLAVARADVPTWREVVEDLHPPSYPFSNARHRELALNVLNAFDALGQELEQSEINLTSGAPRPEPEWRAMPRI